MSYNVRDDQALFGPLAGVEIPNGANASTVVAIPLFHTVGVFGQSAATFAANGTYTVFLAPPKPAGTTTKPLGGLWQVQGVSIFYHTAASGGATVAIENTPAGTADGSGANILSATNYDLSTALTANTPSSLALNTNVNNLIIQPNGRINLVTGATATTGLVDLNITIYVARIA